ncbi:Alanine racemase [Gemmatirosa kalamazoonensis]|uniref:Alanine racemase n=1 Tax=Gemmatirosa kalamazoonensis TaxID=861299 RepID=W0RJV9_9BACT|nr:alanine racemase [Gemmatirosa kalamazoonensis]AHG90630.1 Alanine racemase [Gemmatirosa kalamazoonensis]
MTDQSNPHHAVAEPHDADDPDRQRAWLDVDLAALRRNAAALARRARVPLLPMVKADAYGLGALAVTRALESLDPWGYGVATVAEGEELRAAGIARRILVFTPLLPTELPRAHRAGLTPSLHRADDVVRWTMLGGAAWHLSIDTGMGRAGVRWDAMDAVRAVAAAHPPEGAYTHFHSADTDQASRAEQEHRFRAALDALPLAARPTLLHAENSPAIEHRAPSPWSLARPGVFLYGVPSGGALEAAPVAHLRARVVDLHTVRAGETVSYAATWRAEGDRIIATVACGYGDGYRRILGNRAVALLHGVRVPVVGRVTMDMTMLDVTGTACAVGDVATLIGRDGSALLTVSDVAAMGDLSPYELLTGLRQRVPRRYLHAA